jgi:hypothetical protein
LRDGRVDAGRVPAGDAYAFAAPWPLHGAGATVNSNAATTSTAAAANADADALLRRLQERAQNILASATARVRAAEALGGGARP